MRIWNHLEDWAARRHAVDGLAIGFVPTMGALHRGHASLVERCRRENEIVVVSIFVNPTQFNDPKDLERYPRTLAEDCALLRGLRVDDVIVPDAAELYPPGMNIRIAPDHASLQLMEGAHRPGFLEGMLTVVLKLLNIVRPGRAYFGEKDYQQWKAIADMAREFFLPTEIVACETVREKSGLAESSRNRLLSKEAQVKAACLSQALKTAADASTARVLLEANGFMVDYVEEHWGRRFGAAFLEGVRLIDNVPLRKQAGG